MNETKKSEARSRDYQVVTKRHVVEQRSEYHFAVLGPNPDYGKEGVCYSGEFFTVCTTDGVEEAKRIAKALDMLALVNALSEAKVLS